MSNLGDSHRQSLPHIALFPSAGMGHLTPFLRLSAILASRGCHITIITPQPTVSVAESQHMDGFFKVYPNINRLEFQITTEKPSGSTTDDPFFLQWLSISQSSHTLSPLLKSLSPPITAFFSDLVAGLCIAPIAEDLKIPNYFVFTTSARFVSLLASLPSITFNNSDDEVLIPGLPPFPKSSIPPPFFNPKHIFTELASANVQLLSKAKGMLVNTFDYFEHDTITDIKNSNFLSHLPPIFPIGPLKDYKIEKGNYPSWQDNQEERSVVYVSFGSRTAMSRDQIQELGEGLQKSGFPFLWVLKTSKVDKEDEGEVRELLGESFFEKTSKRGILVRGWAEQEVILAHPSIGGFVSHCGWNSVTEATQHGVRVLAWPLHGDQRVNAEVVEKAGLGVWEREWGWGGQRLIKGDEISVKIREMMNNEKLKIQAKKIGDEAKKAFEVNGSSEKALSGLISTVKQNSTV